MITAIRSIDERTFSEFSLFSSTYSNAIMRITNTTDFLTLQQSGVIRGGHIEPMIVLRNLKLPRVLSISAYLPKSSSYSSTNLSSHEKSHGLVNI